jgi:hypothetical protein
MSGLRPREPRRSDEIKEAIKAASRDKLARITFEIPREKFHQFHAISKRVDGSFRKACEKLVDLYLKNGGKIDVD